MEPTAPRGLAVRISAVHMCKTHRGVHARTSQMINSAYYGVLDDRDLSPSSSRNVETSNVGPIMTAFDKMQHARAQPSRTGVMYRSTKTYDHNEGLSCCFRQWRADHSHSPAGPRLRTRLQIRLRHP